MAFCVSCGRALGEGEKFCSNCGTENKNVENTKQQYTGKVMKCPNCGEIVNAFVVMCPTCGYEFRGTKTSESVQEFARRIAMSKSIEEQAKQIRSFPIPNTREDVFEFMILASTNIAGETQRIVFEAWLAKFEQCYQKAKLLFGDDNDFNRIQAIYEKTSKQITKEKTVHNVRGIKELFASIAAWIPNPIFGVALVLVIIFVIFRLSSGYFGLLDILIDGGILWKTYNISNKD